jgi:hypothetical protein
MTNAARNPEPEIEIIHPVADVDRWLREEPGRTEKFIRFLGGIKGGNR